MNSDFPNIEIPDFSFFGSVFSIIIFIFVIILIIGSFVLAFLWKFFFFKRKDPSKLDSSATTCCDETNKCKNCGANVDGFKCEYCGYKKPKPKKETFGSFFENIQKNINAYQISIPQNKEELEALKEKNKQARLAIDNNKCPECGTEFKSIVRLPLSSSCKKCGAMLDKNLYIDRF